MLSYPSRVYGRSLPLPVLISYQDWHECLSYPSRVYGRSLPLPVLISYQDWHECLSYPSRVYGRSLPLPVLISYQDWHGMPVLLLNHCIPRRFRLNTRTIFVQH